MNGSAHRTMTTILLGTAPLLSIQYGASVLQAYLLTLGIVLTYWVNPDLDLNYVSHDLFHLYWWPYSRAFHHRSFWSHFPIISTLIRLTYFGWALLFAPTDWTLVAWAFVGMALSDAFHWVLDWKLWHDLDIGRQ